MTERKNTLPKLDRRLQVIADCIPKDAVVADLGTDHGYLMAYLVASGRISSGFATDIHQKPLEKAAFSLKSAGAAQQVKLCLCNGLSGLRGETFTHVVIAGMGGDLIWEIVSAADWCRNVRFILQPMTKAHHLRQRLCAAGFSILQEHPAVAGKFAYTVLEVVFAGEKREIDLRYAYLGELEQDESAEGVAYRQRMAAYFAKKAAGLSKAGNPAEQKIYSQLLELVKAGDL